MNTRSMKTEANHLVLATVVVVCCTVLSFGLSRMFPQGERWLAEWQLSSPSPTPVSSSIVLVRADEASLAFCGEGRWNLPALESMLRGLHQSGASVIAPLIDVPMPVPSKCGGLSGLVNLAEVTTHVGSVVYPDSVPPVLAQAAGATGALRLTPQHDAEVPDFTFSSSSLHSAQPLFGAAVAELASTDATSPDVDAFLHVPRTLPKNSEARFPTYAFSEVWHLLQAGEREQLSHLFNGKTVFLFSGSSMSQPLSASLRSNVPVVMLHAMLAEAYLTNAWQSTSPFWVAFLLTVSLGGLLSVFVLRERSFRDFALAGFAVVMLASGFLFLGFHWGWILPLFSMGLRWGMTIGGIVIRNFLQSRVMVQQRIAQRERQLTQLGDEFVEKQQHVRQLEARLHDAQQDTNHTVAVVEELQVSRNTAVSQLEQYQDELYETRRKIDGMEEELHDLRQHLPSSLAEFPLELSTTDCPELIQECEASHILTHDPAVLRLFQNLKKGAATEVPILLLGETGTGKEVFAKAAHALSPRRQGPFISVNMAAIRSELFEGELFGHVKGAFTGAVGRTGFLESAYGGTLFLDEVGDLPLDLQAKLLRFLEDGGFHRVGQSSLTHSDARIIAATNRDLLHEVQAGRYREDLYYRLRGMVLKLPPLRARSQADHVLLAQSFLQRSGEEQHRPDLVFTQGALEAIVAHQWPGNIREMRQTIAQAVALATGSIITEGDLNFFIPPPTTPGDNWVKEDLGQREDAMVLECLRRHKFEMQATAATLGWDRGTVTQRLKGLGFQALMDYHGNIQAAAQALAGDERFVRIVEGRLRGYANNLMPSSKDYGSVEEAIADCRKRFRNLPERHFPAVEHLIQARFPS